VPPQEPGGVHGRGTSWRPAAPAARPAILREAAGPLSEVDFDLLRQAAAARGPVRRAARTARTSAITILAVGALGVPLLAVSPSWLGLLMVLGIAAVGVVEYVGARRMRRGEPTAAVFLARNQVAFMGLIVAYCLIRMLTFSPAQARVGLLSSELQSELSQLPGFEQDIDRQLQSWAPLVTYGFYALVIVLSLAAQGGLALYYFTRRRHLEALEHDTPAWIRRLFRELDV